MNRETTETKTDEARMNDMDILMSLVNEKRTLIQFQMAEKIVKTYRIKAPSFRAAKGMIDNTHFNNGIDEDYDGDVYCEMDGWSEYWETYQPVFDEKIKQVKIGWKWYDVSALKSETRWYLESDININRELWLLYPNGIADVPNREGY